MAPSARSKAALGGGLIHLPHAPLADEDDDIVMGEAGAGFERHDLNRTRCSCSQPAGG